MTTRRLKLGQGVAGHVALTGQPLRVVDAYQDPRFDPSFDLQSGFKTRSLLAVPIMLDGEMIGVLEVINKTGQDSFDEQLAGIEVVRLAERDRRGPHRTEPTPPSVSW